MGLTSPTDGGVSGFCMKADLLRKSLTSELDTITYSVINLEICIIERKRS